MPICKGAIPTPAHKLAAAHPHVASNAVPDAYAIVPPRLSVWGNTTYGCCVTSEEMVAKAAYSLMAGGEEELFIDEQTAIEWAASHNYLNGAILTDVMDMMARVGIASGGLIYTDGPYQAV